MVDDRILLCFNQPACKVLSYKIDGLTKNEDCIIYIKELIEQLRKAEGLKEKMELMESKQKTVKMWENTPAGKAEAKK